ncbi:RHS repeat-associated core domain-containing protein [Streptomyces sp. NPDC000594]|uniref:RHS repeat-associated core domain-containing protein n=1 Tax=Streptomyces sp. NPDC000594 TaxID=3154261 RepID=UPI00331D4D63
MLIPAIGAALLAGLLPASALALPPNPAPNADANGREELSLEKISRSLPVPGVSRLATLDQLKVDVPEDQRSAPAGTTTPVAPATAQITFPSGGPAARSATADAPSPVGNLPVSLGRAEGQAAPTGTWGVTVHDRATPVGEGADGAVISVDGPTTGAVPISVKVDYGKFQNLNGADWASRLRLVQFPDCYRTTPELEECHTYEELETVNDTRSKSLTATVDPAAEPVPTDPESPTPPALVAEGDAPLSAPQARTAAAASGGGSATFGLTDSGAGEGGAFKATPLANSGSWAAGSSSGAFSWTYPLAVPPPPAGPAPEIAFSYNSQSVDGRTAVSSPQSSWIGEGWEYDPGHIERRYRSCEDDRKTLGGKTPNNTAKKNKTADLCWVSDNAVMSLGGRTTELVLDTAAQIPAGSNTQQIYRPQQDDGTRVELKETAGTNRDNNGEYWLVTTPDGTKHYYGLNKVGGGHAETDSVSTVPVFGNHPDEPCHATTFAASRCGSGKQQAWRWGLDKVVDVHDNAMVIDWHQSSNHYAVRKKFKSPERYDRAAYPDLIEYGMREGDLTKPAARVNLVAAQRCLATGTICDSANFDKTTDPGAYRHWWDSPGNLNCKATQKNCSTFPSFWTRLRLSEVVTEAQRPGSTALQKVDSYKLHQSFPSDWYDTSPGLWLNSITRTGYAPGDTTGTVQHRDGVSFGHYKVGSGSPLGSRLKDRQLPNLVRRDSKDQRPGFTRPRIGTVFTEAGGEVSVEYKGGCAIQPTEDKERYNTTCYPVRWSPDGDEKTPKKAWFNKYVVDSVTESDRVSGHGKPILTKYGYEGANWSKSQDEFTRPAITTYSDWRGYRQVTSVKGSKTDPKQGNPQPQTKSVTRYFLGAGGTVKDSTGTEVLVADDHPTLAGHTAESITYTGTSGKILKRGLQFPWVKQTASRARQAEDGTNLPALTAHRSGIRRVDDIQTVGTSYRTARVLTEFEPTYGLPIEVETLVATPNGTGETLSERRCATSTYVHNTGDWIIGLHQQERETATPCGTAHQQADPATELMKSVRTSYDGKTFGAIPTKGLVTSVAEIDGKGTSHSIETKSTYDPLGRLRTVTAPGAGTTETQYTPGDSGGAVTSTKVINDLGHAVTTTYDPGRHLPLTVSDPNGRVTRNEYDALGRLVKGWSPSRSSGGKSPNAEFTYAPATVTSEGARPASVTARTLKNNGDRTTAITLYDGLGRQIQTQSEAHGPGRIITDTKYDDHGLVEKQTSPYLAKGEPRPEPFEVRSPTLVPSHTMAVYDGLERQVRLATYHGGKYQYEARTSYGDTSTTIDPPGSTSATVRTVTDAVGRVSSIEHYTKTDRNASRVTSYGYDKRGHRSEVKDPAGNTWSFTYDARGRVTESRDPDTGETRTEYDDADRAVKVTNGRLLETRTDYDTVGRVKAVWEGTGTTPAEQFTYDSLPGGLGKPVATTRNTSVGAITSRVTGYDSEYRPTGRETVIPAHTTTTGLSGTYAYSYTYTQTGMPKSVTLPAKGGLAQEKVLTRYNEDDLPEVTAGHSWYTSDVTYSPYGEVMRSVSGGQPYRVWTTNFLNEHTRGLARTVVDRETAGPHRVSDSYYSYDTSGTITSSARQLANATGETWDNQCFTYDLMGELVHAWTSNVAPRKDATGCKSANGAVWGHRDDGGRSAGPVAEAPDAATDTTSPDAALTASLANAAPDTATVATGSTAYRQSFAFDWIGNRAKMTEHDPANAANNVTYTYSYGRTAGNGTGPSSVAQPHTLTSVTSSAASRASDYTYDAGGNTTRRNFDGTTQDQDLKWTTENRLDTITENGVTTRYVYDAEGNRVLEHSPKGATLYLGETELTTDSTGKITNASRAYPHAGAATVVRSTKDGATTGHSRSVMIADHLGTANTAIEIASGQTVTRRAFKPYGEIRGTKPANWPNKRSYLGVGIDDAATGLTHIGAREYDQASGRFISADPIMDISDPLQMNGYAYSNNSPVSKSDPTGLMRAPDTGSGTVSNGEKRAILSRMYRADGLSPHQARNAANQAWYNWTIRPKIRPYYLKELPGVVFNMKIPGMGKYVKIVKEKIKEKDLWREYGPDPSSPTYNKEVAGVLMDACMEYCPEGKDKVFRRLQAETAKVGIGRGVGRGARGPRNDPCPSSFVPGTRVLMADGTTKPIEDVRVGDRVLATNPKTGRTQARTVTAEINSEGAKTLVRITIDLDGKKGGPTDSLTATDAHPFWVPELREWLDATDLAPGQWLRTSAGTHVQITAIKRWTQQAAVHNLSVGGIPTYYVLAGAAPVLVHNCDSRPDGPDPDGNIVYRALAANDDPANGLTARDPSNAGVSPLSHVAGKKLTPWISTTKNPGIAFDKYNQGHGVVAIDLRRIPYSYVDISSGPFPSSRRHSAYARKDSEVLVWQNVPAEAIVDHWPGG